MVSLNLYAVVRDQGEECRGVQNMQRSDASAAQLLG